MACSAQKFESALTDAFNRTDEEFGKADNAALVGTTAVVALVGSRQLYIANCGAQPCRLFDMILNRTIINFISGSDFAWRGSASYLPITNSWQLRTCLVPVYVWGQMQSVAGAGDSRAVLCRSSVAIPLTDDHKAAREDETVRFPSRSQGSVDLILFLSGSKLPPADTGANGLPCAWPYRRAWRRRVGQILFWNGVRVMGVLAVSRAIGDHCLRPFVIAQPEVRLCPPKASSHCIIK